MLEKEVKNMKVQQTTNNKQSFGMAWKANLKGMSAEDIKVITRNTDTLNSAFANIEAKISKKYCYRPRGEKNEVMFPINKVTTWLCDSKDDKIKYVFEMTNINKSFLEKIKSFFGKGIKVQSKSEDIRNITKEQDLDTIFWKSITKAKNNYFLDTKVIEKKEKHLRKLKIEKLKTARNKAIEEFNNKNKMGNHLENLATEKKESNQKGLK